MRKICYVSGTRADFGLLSSTLVKASQHPDLDISVCLTGMHALDSIGELGKTAQEVINTGLRVCGIVETPVLGERSNIAMAKAISAQISGFTDIFDKEKFDFIIVLGDRGEMLAAAIVALHLGIPTIHIHGGERSGTVDEPVRHAISKLSHYHFVAVKEAKERLIKMGENPGNIFYTGAPGLDDIYQQNFISKEELYYSVGFDIKIKTCLVIYHPVVQEQDKTGKQIYDLLEVINSKDLQAIILMPNTDAGSHGIVKGIQDFSSQSRFKIYDHLPRAQYLNWLNACDFMIGNSSSGIIEACSLQKPVIDVGNRQKMREISPNTIRISNCPIEISSALDQVLQETHPRCWENVYGDGQAGERIVSLLAALSLDRSILDKLNSY